MSISNTSSKSTLFAVVMTCTAIFISSCKQDPIDPSSQRIRLGEIRLALASSSGNTTDAEFSGRVIRFGNDTTVASKGSFSRHIQIRDSIANRIVAVLYTLPNNVQVKTDTTMRVICIFKQINDKSALILRTKNDSLVCMIGTLLPGDLEAVQTKSGAQGFRVAVGNDVYASRNTACGREGDYNMTVSTNAGVISVAPARSGKFQSGDKMYTAYNVANTQIIKSLSSCQNSVAEFAYMIIKE